jgi:hypothetical protein
VVNWDGVLKQGDKPKGDHATHLWVWIEIPITRSLFWKCSYTNDTIEEEPMMWVLFIMDGNKQEGKWLVVECKAIKWVNANNALPRDHLDKLPWQRGWLWHHLHDYDGCKIRETLMHIIHKQRGWITWCFHPLHEDLEIWPLLTSNWRCLPCLTRKQPSRGEGLGCT